MMEYMHTHPAIVFLAIIVFVALPILAYSLVCSINEELQMDEDIASLKASLVKKKKKNEKY